MRWNRKGEDSEQAEFMIAQGRSRAWQTLGESEGDPVSGRQQPWSPVQIPNHGDSWRNLYRREGRMQDAARASAKAASLDAGQSH